MFERDVANGTFIVPRRPSASTTAAIEMEFEWWGLKKEKGKFEWEEKKASFAFPLANVHSELSR